jgi:outer membrane receptor for Fe3+-dicitrate
MLGVTICALTLGSAMANRPVVEQKSQKDNADYEYVYLTGSHIPQRVMKRNIITVGKDGPVLTIDQREMERNGNQPIADQLARYPGIQISHH